MRAVPTFVALQRAPGLQHGGIRSLLLLGDPARHSSLMLDHLVAKRNVHAGDDVHLRGARGKRARVACPPATGSGCAHHLTAWRVR